MGNLISTIVSEFTDFTACVRWIRNGLFATLGYMLANPFLGFLSSLSQAVIRFIKNTI